MRWRITLPAVACLVVTCLLGAPAVRAQVAPLPGRDPAAADTLVTTGIGGTASPPYNKIATAPVQLNSNGQPFFDPREEVSDIGTVAEVLADQPVTFTEPYFPTRLLTDVGFMILGNRGGDLSYLKYDGLAKRPVETILGGDGLVVQSGLAVPGNAVIVPFYHHLDVGGLAAGAQNNGRPEQVSTTLTHFILTGVPGPA